MDIGRQQRVNVSIDGHVQGVGFREFTYRHAQRLGLTGYVNNKRDHTVEIVAEGPRQSLNAFIEALHEGPPEAIVRSVNATFAEATGQYVLFTVEG